MARNGASGQIACLAATQFLFKVTPAATRCVPLATHTRIYVGI